MDESLEETKKSFQVDPDGLLFYPTLITCLGILAFFLLSGATWEICRKSRMCKMKLPGNAVLSPELLVVVVVFCFVLLLFYFILFNFFLGGRGLGAYALRL